MLNRDITGPVKAAESLRTGSFEEGGRAFGPVPVARDRGGRSAPLSPGTVPERSTPITLQNPPPNNVQNVLAPSSYDATAALWSDQECTCPVARLAEPLTKRPPSRLV